MSDCRFSSQKTLYLKKVKIFPGSVPTNFTLSRYMVSWKRFAMFRSLVDFYRRYGNLTRMMKDNVWDITLSTLQLVKWNCRSQRRGIQKCFPSASVVFVSIEICFHNTLIKSWFILFELIQVVKN